MNDQSFDEVLVSGDGPIRTITLNRPEHLNAVNEGMHHGLGRVWSQIAEDADARVVILTGAGRAFSAGGDLEMLSQIAGDPEFRYRQMRGARQIVTEMIAFPLPVIAAVNGPAVGLGCSIAVLSDIVFISESAYFADPHVSLGLVAADGGALAWPVFISLLRAKEYLFTGDRIDAATAERIGLANRVVQHENLLVEATALAERLAQQPRQALQDTKRALNLHLKRSIADVIDFAFSAESENFASMEFAEMLSKLKTR